MVRYDAHLRPPPKMRQQPRRNWNGRLSFLRRHLTLRKPVEDAVVEIDKRPANAIAGGCNGACPGAGVQTDKYESRKVTQRPLLGLYLLSF
jgi:hypothetical protein